MLRQNRLTSPAEFQTVYRSGIRSRAASVIAIGSSAETPAPKVGFAASKKIGSAVVRNRAKRRLRAVVTNLIPAMPGRATVLQATIRTASEPWQKLETDVCLVLTSVGALDA